MENFLQSVVDQVPGIKSIAVTDRDGVEIYCMTESPEETQVLSVIFALTHEQVQKLEEFSQTNYLWTEHEDGSSMLQLNASPLHILINAIGVSRQVLVDAGHKCRLALEPLRKEIATANSRMQ